MTTIDIGSLLSPVSAEAPCGEDLAYDSAFLELAQAAQTTKADRMVAGDTATAETDWRAVRKQAAELFSRTKDLRVAIVLTRGLVNTAGIGGLAEGIDCLRQLLEQYWQGVHPLLDADDDNDPTMRLNVLKELCDRDGMLVPVRNAPLVSFPALGTFGLRHVGLATGEIKLPEGSTETPPALDLIEGAFRNCKVEELQATAAHVQQTIANLKAIENFVTQQVGLNNALRLPELIDTLLQMERVLAPRLAARGAVVVDGSNGVETNGAGTGAGTETRVAIGQVGSRDDVLRLLDKIVEYYERHEPSSPIPVLLRRCKRLVPMQFVDIVRELVPDGLTQFETLRGPSDEA